MSDIEQKQRRRLTLVLALTTTFFGVEMAGAVLAKSDVLRADALHLFMDLAALTMSLVAMRLANRSPSARFSFGLRRAEPMAAAINGVLVLSATLYIVQEGVASLRGDVTPEVDIMMVVSLLALVINGFSAWLIHGAMGHHGHDHDGHDHGHDHGEAHDHAHHDHDHAHHDHDHAHHDHDHAHHDHDHAHHDHDHAHHDHDHDEVHHHHDATAGKTDHSLNLRGAWLHLLGDALGSLAALVTAIALRFGAPRIIDPIASFLVAIILLVGATRLLRDAARVLLEGAPKHLPPERIERAAVGAGAFGVHDAHAWTLGAGHHAVAVRILAKDLSVTAAVEEAIKALGVTHVFVHVEPEDASSPESCPIDHGKAAEHP